MKIPGVVWSVLIVALPLLAAWLGESFPAALWAGPVAGMLLIIWKTLDAVRPQPAPPPGVNAALPAQAAREEPALTRWLWG